MTLAAALREAATQLAGISQTPRLDAELLMAHALGTDRSGMLLRQADLSAPEDYASLIQRRLAHEPVAYITGKQDFWDLTLSVTSAVLIPRSDSETLIDAAAEAFYEIAPPSQILDLGTGSGALLLAVLSLFPGAKGTGIDASSSALDVANLNAQNLGFGKRSRFLNLDWRQAGWVEKLKGPYDMILCNPPYVEDDADLASMVVEYEPHSALFAGADGLDDYNIILPEIPALLSSNGVAIFEIGHTQAIAVSNLASEEGLSSELRHDLAGKPRALVMRRRS